jgi:hypothetical protein
LNKDSKVKRNVSRGREERGIRRKSGKAAQHNKGSKGKVMFLWWCVCCIDSFIFDVVLVKASTLIELLIEIYG